MKIWILWITNCPLDQLLDKKGGASTKSKSVISCVDDFKSKLDLVDIWRSKNPDGQFPVGDDEKNKTILIFVFIFIPKW